MGGLLEIVESYKGLTIELKNSGKSYIVYDYGKITGEKVHIISGGSVKENAFSLEYVKEQIDLYLKEIGKN